MRTGFIMKLPNTIDGQIMLQEFKRRVNKATYRVVVKFTGPRPYKHAGSTRKADATGFRVYLIDRKTGYTLNPQIIDHSRTLYGMLSDLRRENRQLREMYQS